MLDFEWLKFEGLLIIHYKCTHEMKFTAWVGNVSIYVLVLIDIPTYMHMHVFFVLIG
jgi:hypothetical protein